MLAPWKGSYDKPRRCIKKQRYHFVDKDPCSQSYGFSSNHVRLWELDHEEGWMPKNLTFELCPRRLDRPLDCKKTQPIHPKGNQPWIFIGRTDAEVEAPILWPPDEKNWLLGEDWCWERLKAGGEGDDRGWVGWMASPTQWTWVWASSGGQWRTGQPGELQSMGSQRVGHDRATQQQQQDCSGPCGCQSDEAVLSYFTQNSVSEI